MKLHLNKELFNDAVRITAQQMDIKPIYVEKDYWVTLVLHALYHSAVKDEVIFKGFATKNKLSSNLEQERDQFFSKGQACLRASPLTKRYGWGIHHDAEGKVAMYPMESEAYQAFMQDSGVKKYKAMRSKRK